MRAIDTNIVVRYLTGDHPEHSALAKTIIEAGDIFVATSVMLEADWVLRSVYRFSRNDTVLALRAFAGLPGVRVGDPALLAQALDLAEAGMDFADALHVGAALGCDDFLTFDQKFIHAAQGQTQVRVVAPDRSASR